MPNDLISEELLDAIAMVESHNNPRAVGDKALKQKAYGAYQMRQPAFDDVRQRHKQYANTRLEDILGDAKTQRELARLYLNVLANDYGLSTFEKAVMGYNAGPTAIQRGEVTPKALRYLGKVKGQMRPR